MSPQRQWTQAPTQRQDVQMGHLEAPGPEIMAPIMSFKMKTSQAEREEGCLALPMSCGSPFGAQLEGTWSVWMCLCPPPSPVFPSRRRWDGDGARWVLPPA